MEQRKTSPDFTAVPLGIRFRADYVEIMNMICEESKHSIDKRQILELAFLNFLEKIQTPLTYNGFDLKEYGNLCFLEKMRNMAKKERNELLSSALFITRMRKDIFKLLAEHKNVLRMNKENLRKRKLTEDLIKTIEKYLNSRLKEARFYLNKNDLEYEIKYYKEFLIKEDLLSMKTYIENQILEDKKELVIKTNMVDDDENKK